MNGLCGLLRLDGQPIIAKQLDDLIFHSPVWLPDNKIKIIQQNFGLTITQRFVTPQCHKSPLPFEHAVSGYRIVSAAYLSNHADLCGKLKLTSDTADCELILKAYLLWGKNCTQYFSGVFMFFIWHVEKQEFFLATDHFGQYPCFYSYCPDKYFIFSNYIVPFKILLPEVSVNDELFKGFSLDFIQPSETCYKEINRLLPANQLLFCNNKLNQTCYWKLKDKKIILPCKTREDYLELFRETFTKTVNNYLRTDYNVYAHVSGGLDSSSIAAIAANFLNGENNLYGFTAVPLDLQGPSYKPGWYYHETHLVDDLLKQYPNIINLQYTMLPDSDPFQQIKQFYSLIDQPIRNVFNFDWILACLKQASGNNARIVLCGQNGNGTISWKGQFLKQRLAALYYAAINWLKPFQFYREGLLQHNKKFLETKSAKLLARNRAIVLNQHDFMLNQKHISPRISSLYPITLWYGVTQLDPTADVRLTEFCYNVPQYIYRKGNDKIKNRLLVREGLKSILPESIHNNPYRGQQSADAFLSYKNNYKNWMDELLSFDKNKKNGLLWEVYDKDKMLGLFKIYGEKNQITSFSDELNINSKLIRVLSFAFFLDFCTT